jgi:hypothetical protein
MTTVCLFSCLWLPLAACGDDDGAPTDGDSGVAMDSGREVDASNGVDSGGPGKDSGTAPMGDHMLDASVIFDGSLWLTGTIVLPEDTSGLGMQLHVRGMPDEGFGGSFSGPVGTTTGGEVEYAITGLADGEYFVQLRVDATANGMVGESGDWEGYYDGSVEAPIFEEAGAPAVVVRSAPTADVDLGIGILP